MFNKDETTHCKRLSCSQTSHFNDENQTKPKITPEHWILPATPRKVAVTMAICKKQASRDLTDYLQMSTKCDMKRTRDISFALVSTEGGLYRPVELVCEDLFISADASPWRFFFFFTDAAPSGQRHSWELW